MKSLFHKIFLENWQRKLVALMLAIITWLVVNHSLSITKTLHDIPVKIVNIPLGKTVEGMQANNILSKKISLRLTGNKKILEELSDGDLQVIIDAEGKKDQWVASVSKKNLLSFNPDINIMQGVNKITQQDVLLIKLTNLITEKIPIVVTNPIGEAPSGYQFLDIWPYQLYLTVQGPEKIVKQLKSKGLKLTFNLNNVNKRELDAIYESKKNEEISFLVPDEWKKISYAPLSDVPLQIDDPRAKLLRIDFALTQNIALDTPIPFAIFFPLKFLSQINPTNCSIMPNDFIQIKNGLPMISEELYARNTSRLFIDIVKERMQIVIIPTYKAEKLDFLWSVQFIYPHELEDRYVAKILAGPADDSIQELQPHLREEYLRNRFHSYMHRFRLYLSNHKKLSLNISLEDSQIEVTPKVSDTP